MSEHRNGPDLIVVGGGVIGLAIARDAHARGLEVTVLEARRAGREASWAAAGMLSPLSEALEPGPFLEFALGSLRSYAAFVAELEEETGIAVEYREAGKLRLARSEADESALRTRLEWACAQGVRAEWMDAAEVRRTEPGLASDFRGALLLEDDFRLDNRALADALAESLRRRGADLREGVRVRGVVSRGGRTAGVRLSTGKVVESGAVLLAAGAWTGGLDGLPEPLPIRPVRGQMLSLRPTRRPTRALESDEVYLVPREDGRVLVGSTEDDVGFRRGTTAEGIRGLLAGALRLVPTLGEASIAELWSGFRPSTPDGLPIMGAHPTLQGLFLATGHFRNGILLAPATARALGAAVTGEEAPDLPIAFTPARFAGAAR